MKSERRHELDKNELAQRLAKAIEGIKPYQNSLLAAVLLVLVVTISYGWWVRHTAKSSEEGWDDFYQAMAKIDGGGADFEAGLSDLDDIIQQHPDTYLAFWAGLVAGDLHLHVGCNQLFVDKAAANQELRQAVERYKEVLQAAHNPILRERATFGLARATEALAVDLNEAEKLYVEVATNWPNGAYAEEAKRRAEDLRRPATREAYDKFHNFDPKPGYLDEPGIPGEKPAFDLDSLGNGPVFNNSPAMKLEEKGADSGPPPSTPETSTKPEESSPGAGAAATTEAGAADTATEPASAGPAETKPAEAKPAETEPAATEPPASGAPEASQPDPGQPAPPESAADSTAPPGE